MPSHNVDYRWCDRPYYLGPDGFEADYFGLAAALAHADAEGIARWVTRGKEYTGRMRLRHLFVRSTINAFISAISSSWVLMMPSASSRTRGSEMSARSLVKMAIEW